MLHLFCVPMMEPPNRERGINEWRLVVAVMFFLLASLIILAFWAKSFWKGNGLGYISYTGIQGNSNRCIHEIEIVSGFVIVGSEQSTIYAPVGLTSSHLPRGLYLYSPQPRYAYINWTPRQTVWNRLGFFELADLEHSDKTFARIVIPGWSILLPVVLLATVLFKIAHKDWLRKTREARGQCFKCGYDLRWSPTRCPECGMERGCGIERGRS